MAVSVPQNRVLLVFIDNEFFEVLFKGFEK